MASPALEFADGSIDVVGAPGVTAALAAAAVLGAPLGHDHAAISLSDLHTPWEAIERRISAAAEADFVVCFYNPRSSGPRRPPGEGARAARGPPPAGTPVGMVADASRPGQRITLSTLAGFDPRRRTCARSWSSAHPRRGSWRPDGDSARLPVEGEMIAVTSACQGCGACLLTCPERAIRPDGRGAGRRAACRARSTVHRLRRMRGGLPGRRDRIRERLRARELCAE